MLYLMQLAIYSGTSTVSLPLTLIAMLKDGLQYVSQGWQTLSTYVYVCAEYIFPSSPVGSIASSQTHWFFMKGKWKKKIVLVVVNVF